MGQGVSRPVQQVPPPSRLTGWRSRVLQLVSEGARCLAAEEHSRTAALRRALSGWTRTLK